MSSIKKRTKEPKKQLTLEEKEEVIKKIMKGLNEKRSQGEMAREHNIDQTTVSLYIKEFRANGALHERPIRKDIGGVM